MVFSHLVQLINRFAFHSVRPWFGKEALSTDVVKYMLLFFDPFSIHIMARVNRRFAVLIDGNDKFREYYYREIIHFHLSRPGHWPALTEKGRTILRGPFQPSFTPRWVICMLLSDIQYRHAREFASGSTKSGGEWSVVIPETKAHRLSSFARRCPLCFTEQSSNQTIVFRPYWILHADPTSRTNILLHCGCASTLLMMENELPTHLGGVTAIELQTVLPSFCDRRPIFFAHEAATLVYKLRRPLPAPTALSSDSLARFMNLPKGWTTQFSLGCHFHRNPRTPSGPVDPTSSPPRPLQLSLEGRQVFTMKPRFATAASASSPFPSASATSQPGQPVAPAVCTPLQMFPSLHLEFDAVATTAFLLELKQNYPCIDPFFTGEYPKWFNNRTVPSNAITLLRPIPLPRSSDSEVNLSSPILSSPPSRVFASAKQLTFDERAGEGPISPRAITTTILRVPLSPPRLNPVIPEAYAQAAIMCQAFHGAKLLMSTRL